MALTKIKLSSLKDKLENPAEIVEAKKEKKSKIKNEKTPESDE